MGRKRQPERVLVFQDHGRGGWRVVHVRGVGKGSRTSRSFPTEAQARRHVRVLERQIAVTAGRTVGEARDEYLAHQRAKRLKDSTLSGNEWSINLFFPDEDEPIASLTPAACLKRYRELAGQHSVDYQRNTLSQARAFLEWCVGEKWLRENPLAGVKGVGRRKKGKPQLRVDEARKWSTKAFELAPAWPGAVAALMSLYMDLRTGEIVRAKVRDLDDGGKLLVVADSKTEAGKRVLEVPKELRPLLAALAVDQEGEQRPGDAPLLGGPHDRLWPTRWVKRICGLVDVPVVCAQSMRGLHASIAVERGATSHLIARAMGHASSKVTMAHYAKPEAQRKGRARTALKLLRGGKG